MPNLSTNPVGSIFKIYTNSDNYVHVCCHQPGPGTSIAIIFPLCYCNSFLTGLPTLFLFVNLKKNWSTVGLQCFKYTAKWFINTQTHIWVFKVGSSGKASACQCRRCRSRGFNPWARKIPWRRKWQPTPVFLPGKFHGQRRLYSPWGHKELAMTQHARHTYIY